MIDRKLMESWHSPLYAKFYSLCGMIACEIETLEQRAERAEARVKELETAIMEWGKHISKHKLSTIYRDMIEEKWEKVHIEERNK